MNVRIHMQVTGALLLFLGAGHGVFYRYFGWKKELAGLSLLARQVFMVHHFFIALIVAMLGACSLFWADALLQPGPLSRVMLAGFAAFWFCRLIFQLFVYDPAIWRGRPFYTAMHIIFSIFWSYAAVTYTAALRSVWNG